jgi:transcriptional regulator with XRE-family HTH domain
MLFRQALGEVLRDERLAQRKTLRQISQTGVIALGYLSEIERGDKEVSSEILDGVAYALGIKTHELVIRAGAKLAVSEIEIIPNFIRTYEDYSDLIVRQ